MQRRAVEGKKKKSTEEENRRKTERHKDVHLHIKSRERDREHTQKKEPLRCPSVGLIDWEEDLNSFSIDCHAKLACVAFYTQLDALSTAVLFLTLLHIQKAI